MPIKILSSYLLCLCVAGSLYAQEEKAVVKDCVVSGVVTKVGTAEPVRRALVTMMSSRGGETAEGEEIKGGRTVKTDGAGHFEFRNVSCTEHALLVEKNGYNRLRATNSRTWLEGMSVTLKPAEYLHLAIELEPSTVISGKVIDEEGEPMMMAQVSAVSASVANGQRPMVPAGSVTTDDRGEYRIFGLPPGRYFVKVEFGNRMRMSYGSTYYPNAKSMEQAIPLTLKPGLEARADIRFVASHLARVTGHIQGLREGEQAEVTLTTVGGYGGTMHELFTQDAFKFEAVVPGDYVVLASQLPTQAEAETSSQ